MCELLFDGVFPPPFTEGSLIEMEPMLLRANDHAGSHETHERYDFVGGKSMAIDQVCSYQTSCPTKPGFAVDSYRFILRVDHLVSQLDEFLDHG